MRFAMNIAVFLAVFAMCQASEKTVAECMEKFGVTVEMSRNGVPDDKKCFFKCVFQEAGAMDKDGKIDPTKSVQLAKDIKIQNFHKVEDCIKDTKAADACDLAKLVYLCIMKP